MLVLRRVAVTYKLRVDPDVDRAKLQRAYDAHAERCPVYRSVHPQITLTTALEVEPA